MPVQSCSEGGKPGFKWGAEGKCYTYDPASAASKAAARMKANKMAAAVKAKDKPDGGGSSY